MWRWMATRLLVSIPVLFGITFLMFVLLRSTPGDPAEYLLNPSIMRGATPEFIAARRAEFGLDQPPPIQYVLWLGEVARGNLGYSYANGRPVGEIILERVGPTARLMGLALLVAVLIGIPIGVVAALKQYSLWDYVIAVLSLGAVSTPLFFLGLAAIYLFSLRLNLLPIGGMVPATHASTVLDEVAHLILPASVLALNVAGPIIRYTRTSVLEVIHQEFVLTARAKGLSERRVVFVHVLRNALLPVISVIGVLIPVLFGGSVVVEQIFSWPGMGQLVLLAVNQRNYPVLMGITLVVAVLVVAASVLTDLAYAIADPRIRLK